MDYPIGISFATRSIGAEGERLEGYGVGVLVRSHGLDFGPKRLQRFGLGPIRPIGQPSQASPTESASEP